MKGVPERGLLSWSTKTGETGRGFERVCKCLEEPVGEGEIREGTSSIGEGISSLVRDLGTSCSRGREGRSLGRNTSIGTMLLGMIGTTRLLTITGSSLVPVSSERGKASEPDVVSARVPDRESNTS